jgi:hypothetical protein
MPAKRRRRSGCDLADERNDDRLTAIAADDPRDQGPERREHENLVAGVEDRAHHRAQRARRPGRDEHVAPFGRHPRALAYAFDDRIDQPRHTLRRGVAMHARMVLDGQVLHAAAVRGLEPRIADVQWIDLAVVGGHAVRERRVDGGSDGTDRRGRIRMARHRISSNGHSTVLWFHA